MDDPRITEMWYQDLQKAHPGWNHPTLGRFCGAGEIARRSGLQIPRTRTDLRQHYEKKLKNG